MNLRYPESAGNSGPRDLIGALLDFEALPGRYPLALREPRALFDRSREVLMLASGRVVEGLAFDPLDASAVQRAACFFVRMAMLRPGADHYTMLGLEPGFQKATLRDHYRMLIRLTHPDFAASGGAWPAGAATRINLANDVLSSVVRKAEYDSLRASGKSPVGLVNPLAAILPRPMQRERPKVWGWAAGASVGIAALAFVMVQWQGGDVEDIHPDMVAQDAAHQLRLAVAMNSLPKTSAETSKVSPTDPRGKTSSSAAEPTPMKSSDQVAKAAQADRAAQAVEAAKLARVAEEEQAAKLAQAAQAAKETHVAKATQATRAAQAAKDTQLATLAQAAAEAQMVQAAKVAQIAKEAQATKVALTTPVTQEVAQNQSVLVATLVKPSPAPPPSPVIELSGKLNLADAQPALNQLLQSMQAGRGDELLRGLDRSVRQSRGAADLVSAYNLLVGSSRAVRLGLVKLRSRPSADQLVVDGVVQLVLQDEGQPPPVRELHLRALFVQRDGQVVMTELSSGGSRP